MNDLNILVLALEIIWPQNKIFNSCRNMHRYMFSKYGAPSPVAHLVFTRDNYESNHIFFAAVYCQVANV